MASKKQKKRKFSINKKKAKSNMERGAKGVGSRGSTYANLPEDIEWFKPEYKEGKETAIYYLNVVPFVAGQYNPEAEQGDLWWRSKFRVGQPVADGDKVVSPEVYGEKCPMSSFFFEMRDNPDITKKALDKLGTKRRELYYVIDTKEEKTEGETKVRLLDFSTYLFGEHLDRELDSEEYEEEGYEALMFADPEEGRTLKITFAQDSFNTAKYSKVSKISLVERRGKPIEDSIIEDLVDPIEGCLIRKSAKEVEAMMADNDPDGGEGAEDLEIMTRKELKLYIKENDLDITVGKSMDDDDIRDAIQEAMDSEEPEEEDDEEEEEEDDEESVDLDEMSRKELKAYIKENDLAIKVGKSMDEDDIIEAIQEAMNDEGAEDDEEDEDDEDDFYDE